MRPRRPFSLGGQRSQAITEFALVAPVLLLLSFGIIDFGRALYFYTVADGAAREAIRVATAASSPLPTSSGIQAAAAARLPGAPLTTSNGCYNGPLPSGAPPDNQAWIFITQVNPTVGGAVQSNPPFTTANAPGGDAAAAAGTCSAVNPASGYQQLEVTVEYSYVPVTPLVSNLVSGHLVFRLQVTGRTEY